MVRFVAPAKVVQPATTMTMIEVVVAMATEVATIAP